MSISAIDNPDSLSLNRATRAEPPQKLFPALNPGISSVYEEMLHLLDKSVSNKLKSKDAMEKIFDLLKGTSSHKTVSQTFKSLSLGKVTAYAESIHFIIFGDNTGKVAALSKESKLTPPLYFQATKVAKGSKDPAVPIKDIQIGKNSLYMIITTPNDITCWRRSTVDFKFKAISSLLVGSSLDP